MRLLQLSALVVFAAIVAVCSTPKGELSLRTIIDVPLSGGASRFDYQSIDSEGGRLYIAHLGAGLVTVFDINSQMVVGNVPEVKHVHGVLAVPELHRVYATATGTNELVVIDDRSLEVEARIPAGNYPDGIAYASREMKLYVSDKNGKTDTVIDARTNRQITTIELGGGASNNSITVQNFRWTSFPSTQRCFHFL
jgi:YVTN family beta-propeller protein